MAKDEPADAGTPEEAPADPGRERRPLRAWQVWLIVFLLLAMVAGGLVAFSGTARSRAVALVQGLLRRAPAPEKEDPEPVGDPLAQARAELDAERARLEALAEALAAKEAELARREEALAAGEADLAARLARFAQNEAEITRLARLCEVMRPREAAELISRLGDKEALLILGSLDETVAAKILAAMPPDRAAALIKLMAPAEPG